ncbi:MAG: glycosyltransferase family 2 protein [Acidimicrobiia bacterium]|nr:glycosyltransferase family 2 protein [Acidimicrobiia bacterium]
MTPDLQPRTDTRPRVRIIVLSYNGGDLPFTALESLRHLDYPSDRLDIVLLDNGSNDGSEVRLRELERADPFFRVVRSEENLGFAGGNNLSLRDLDGVDYVALMNNDTTVDPRWLAELVDALEASPAHAAACPKMVLAPRFVELRVVSPTFRPGRGDNRDLGVRVSGIEVGGEDRAQHTFFVKGSWGPELGRGAESQFEWTAAEAVLRVPVATDATAATLPKLRVRLAADEAKAVTITSGTVATEITVSSEPRWYDIGTDAEPFDVINNCGSCLVEGGFGADRGFRRPDTGQYDEPVDVFAWCGGSVLMRREYLESVGVFDDAFFLYYEDTDLSWRGRAQGWAYCYVPTAGVRHVHSATNVEGSALFDHYTQRNRLLMLAKNAPLRMLLREVWRYLLVSASYARRDVVAPVLNLHRPNTRLTYRRARSFLGFLRWLPYCLRERRVLRRKQVVADAELLAWAIPQPEPE